MTHDEANGILNAFAGWTPGQRCGHSCDNHKFNRFTYDDGKEFWIHSGPHDIAPTDYFADTPEAREAVRVLKDEYVSRTGTDVDVHIRAVKGQPPLFGVWAGPFKKSGCALIEHRAIALAIAAALKEKRK